MGMGPIRPDLGIFAANIGSVLLSLGLLSWEMFLSNLWDMLLGNDINTEESRAKI